MKNFYFFQRLLLTGLVITMISCNKDDDGPATPDPVAGFTHATTTADPLTVTFTNTSTNATSYSWDFGDQSPASTDANPTHTYAAAGTYTVTLTASRDGISDTESQQVTVTAPVGEDPDDEDPDGEDPDGEEPTLGDNMIVNSELSSDEGWTVTEMDATATGVEFTDDGLIFSNITDQTDIAVWQAVEVEAGRTYQIDALISGTGTQNSWIQFMIGRTEPEDGVTYWTDNYPDAIDFLALYSFEGDDCGIDQSFSGNISEIACAGVGVEDNGMITFDEGGTIYFIIKAGSWEGSLGDGVTVTDASIRPVEEGGE